MPDLPPVREDFIGDASSMVRALEEIAAMANRAAEAVDKLQAAIDALHGKMADVSAGAEEAAAAQDAAATAAHDMAAAENATAESGIHLTDITDVLSRTIDVQREAMLSAAPTAELLGQTHLALADAQNRVVSATDGTNRALGVNIGWLRLGVANWATFLHWVVAGSAEFLAVAIPAAVAMGAGLAVAMQGAQMAQIHMQALYNTMEAVGPAFGKTAGDMLGMGHALQTMQDLANPGVFELLGSAINDIKSSFTGLAGVGLQVVHMWDEFSARITADLQNGGAAQIHGLLSGMTTDLQQFGQVLGNLGHSLLNFASAMPGLAHVLLLILTYLSSVIEVASRGGVFLTMAMGLEEFYRWGGLAASMLVRLLGLTAAMNAYGSGGFIFKFGAALGALGQGAGAAIQAIGSMIGGLGAADGAFARAGAAVNAFGFDLKVAAATASPLAIAASALLPAAMAMLAVAFDHVRNSSQRLIDGVNQAVATAPTMTQAMFALASGAQKASVAMGQQEQILHSYPGYLQATGNAAAGLVTSLEHMAGPLGGAAQGMINLASHSNMFTRAIGQATSFLLPITSAFHFFSAGAASAASQVDQLRAAETQWAATGARVMTNTQALANVFHTSLPGAFAMASAAGVNLMNVMTRGSFAFKIATDQIRNYITGLGAMGAPAGQLGTDMNALAIQSGLAASKVQQLNSALDQVFGMVSGGITNFAQLDQAVRQMGADSQSSSARLNGAFGSISNSAGGANSSVQKMQFTLKGLGAGAAQSLQQVTQSMGLAQQQADFFQTALTSGAIKVQAFDSSIKDIVGIMAPFARGNAAVAASLDVIAQRAGGPVTHSIQQLAQWAGIRGPAAMKALEASVNSTSVNLSHLSVVAQHLGVTMQGQMNAAFSQGVLNALHYSTAMQGLANALVKYPAHSAQVAAAQQKVNTIQNEAAAVTQKYSSITQQSGANAVKAAGDYQKYASATAQASASTAAHVSALTRANGASAEAAAKTASLSGQMSQNASVTQHASSAAQSAAAQVQHLGSVATSTRAQVGTVNNEIRTMTGVAGSGSSAMARLAASMNVAGSSAAAATGQVRGLEAAIASLQSKTITLTTNVVTNTIHRAGGGPVFPGIPTVVGEAGPEMYVPAVPGYIFNHAQTGQMMAGGSSGGGKPAAAPAAPAAGSGGGAGTLVIQMNSREVARAVMPELWRWMTRNQGQVTGSLKPS